MLLNELFESYRSEDHLSPKEIDNIKKKHEKELRAQWMKTSSSGHIDEDKLKRAASSRAEREIRDLVYKKAAEARKKMPSGKSSEESAAWAKERAERAGKQEDRFPQWKISPDGWGGD